MKDNLIIVDFDELKYRKSNLLNKIIFALTFGIYGSSIESYGGEVGIFKDMSLNDNGQVEIISEDLK